MCKNISQMKSTFSTKTISVCGKNWSFPTKNFLQTVGLFNQFSSIFKYEHREALFFEQYDIFIITDFGKNYSEPMNDFWIEELEKLRQVIYTRSMKTVIFANNDDPEISKSLREAGCRIVRVATDGKFIPKAFAEALVGEYFGPQSPSIISDFSEIAA